MKYSEPLVVQGTSEVTPRSTCTEKFNCTTGAKFSCLLGIFFHCSGTSYSFNLILVCATLRAQNSAAEEFLLRISVPETFSVVRILAAAITIIPNVR